MNRSKIEDKSCSWFCSFSAEDPVLEFGRTCTLDHGACFNSDKSELVDRCPTLLAYLRGEPVGQTPDLDYPGVAHVVRSGSERDFIVGMPPEYLTGRLKKGDPWK